MSSNEWLVPCIDGGVKRGWSSSHPAIDFGWYVRQNTNILACDDGKVVDKGTTATMGNYICLEHTYSTGKRFSCYLHLNAVPSRAIGSTVQMGDVIGVKGNTGDSTGTHLHFAITKLMSLSTAYNWNYLSESSSQNKCDFNPYPYLRKSRNVTYLYDDIYPGMPYLTESSAEGTYQKLIDSINTLMYKWRSGDYNFISKVKSYIDSQS